VDRCEAAHLYPNLEYLESSAANKRGDHLEYVGTVLPIEHPWWDTHMPPSAWGCECGVRKTDKPVTPVPQGGQPVNPVFDNNPGKTAEFINTAEHPYVKGVCPIFNTCQYRKDGTLTLSDTPPNRPECKMCLLAIAYGKKIRKEQEAVRKWYKAQMPTTKVGKFPARRFEISHPDTPKPIIINRVFYEEVMIKFKNDPKYSYKLELLIIAHELIKESRYTHSEVPRHHDDVTSFLVFEYDKNGLKIEFKAKENNNGIFLYYMRLL